MRYRFCLAVLLSMLVSEKLIAVDDVPVYFRSDRGIVTDAVHLPETLDLATGVAWKQDLEPGHSTPCLYGDRIFLTTYNPETQELATVALDCETGKRLWRQVAPANRLEPVHQVGSPATATPACDGQRVYVFFGSFGLLCYRLDGTLLWSQPMGPFQDEFGASSSPVLIEDKVIINEDHDIDNFLYAFDKLTGQLVWKVNRDAFTRSYSTPIVCTVDGRNQILVAGALRLTAYDPDNGQPIWWVDGLARIVVPTPVVADGVVYVPSWTPGGDVGQRIAMEAWSQAAARYDRNGDGKIGRSELTDDEVLTRFFRIDLNQDGALNQAEWERHAVVFDRAKNGILAVRLGGEGNVTPSHVVWQYDRGIPYVASPTVYEGVVFLIKDGGILTSLDATTGKPIKQARLRGTSSYYASPVVADGKLYVASEAGLVTVATAEGEWTVLSTTDFGQRIHATPVIRDGRVYVRSEAALYCFAR